MNDWVRIPFLAKSRQVRLSVVSRKPWAYKLWNEDKNGLVCEGQLSFLTDMDLDVRGRWRLDVNMEGLSLKPVVRGMDKSVGIELLA